MSGLDLYLSQRVLAMMAVYAALTGFCLGGVYDLLGLAAALLLPPKTGGSESTSARRSSLTAKGFLAFWQDLIFLLLTAVAFILLCYYTNDGQLRAPAVLGVAGGFFVYRHTVGLLTGRIIPRLATWVKCVLIRTLALAFCPVRWLATALLILIKLLWRVTGGRFAAQHQEKNTNKRIESLTQAASRGFDVMEENSPSGNNPTQPVNGREQEREV